MPHLTRLALLICYMVVAVAGRSVAADFQMVPDPNNPPAEGTYICLMKDGRTLGPNGSLVAGELETETFLKMYKSFIFDAGRGLFLSAHQTLRWVVLRPGNSEWDLIAHLPGVDPSYNILRIEIWNDPIGFTMTNGKELYSGTCKRVE